MKPPNDQIVRSACRICYNNCGVLIHLKDGKAVKISGDPQNPMSRGRLCPKGLASLEYLNHPDRLKHPLRRTGARGAGKWQRVSWDEALGLVADGLTKVKEAYGVLSVAFMRGASKGLADDYLSRFANIFGSPNISSAAPVCFMPGVYGARLTYGYYAYSDYKYPPQTIVLWGFNPTATDIVEHEEILAAVKRGSKLIVVDPLENEITKIADVWIRLRPGTDLAFCLGMLKVIVDENLYDRKFVDTWTVGFSRLKAHLQNYDPENVAELTWVPKEMIQKAARLYARERPGYIRWGNGIETTMNSMQTCRAISMLRAVVGNLGVPGGEVNYSLPGGLPKGDPQFVCQDNIPPEVRAKRMSQMDGMMPTIYYTLPQRVVRAILDAEPYSLRAAYVQGGNLLTHYPHAQETHQALMKLDFLSVADMFMTPTALLADVVLPAATYLEQDSIETTLALSNCFGRSEGCPGRRKPVGRENIKRVGAENGICPICLGRYGASPGRLNETRWHHL